LFTLQDDVIAAAQQTPAAARAHWLTYFHVPDVDTAAAKAQELGGTIVEAPRDVADKGRAATLRDPEGAVFALWQPGTRIGVDRLMEPGCIGWSELLTSAIHDRASFYAQVTGLVPHEAKTYETQYIEFSAGSQRVGGFLQKEPGMDFIPSHWSFYVVVAHCDATVALTQESNGKLRYGPVDMAGLGRMAYLADPGGAAFNVIQLERAA
jgi:hypothetical protein